MPATLRLKSGRENLIPVAISLTVGQGVKCRKCRSNLPYKYQDCRTRFALSSLPRKNTLRCDPLSIPPSRALVSEISTSTVWVPAILHQDRIQALWSSNAPYLAKLGGFDGNDVDTGLTYKTALGKEILQSFLSG